MRRNWITILLAILALVTAAYLTVILHRASEKEVLSQFQEHQFFHAHHIATNIKYFLEDLSSELRVLSSLISFQKGNPGQQRADMEAYFKGVKEAYVKAVSLMDEKGAVIYSTDPGSYEKNFLKRNVFIWAKERENMGRVLISPLFQGEKRKDDGTEYGEREDSDPGSLGCLLAIPFYQGISVATRFESKAKFMGVLFFTVDLKGLFEGELASPDSRDKLNQLWIVENNGRILFQSDQKNMVARNVHQKNPACNECHTSFDFVENILKEKRGTMNYRVGKFPEKLAAFSPMEFENASWVVVVNTPYGRVRAFAARSLWGHLMLMGVVVLVILGSSMIIYRDYRAKVKAEEEMKHWQEQKRAEDALRESAEQVRHLSSQLLSAQEKERRRISRELHDELGGALATLKLRLSFIRKNLQEGQVELRRECEDNLRYLSQVFEDVRRLSRDLSPAVLEVLGLSAALQWLFDNSVKNDDVKVTLDIMDLDRLFSQDAQITIYRIFQEALTNIMKHSRAKNVSAAVKKDDGWVSFVIVDDGKGFDVIEMVTKNVTERGLGLAAMEERTRMLGGSLEVWSEAGKGTRIDFRIPIEQGGNA